MEVRGEGADRGLCVPMASLIFQWVFLRGLEHVQRQIDVQIGPMKMVFRMPLYMAYLPDGRLGEPREIAIR